MASSSPHPSPFQALIAGRKYAGTWHVTGHSLYVSSAYGSARAVLRPGSNQGAVARRLLQQLVQKR